MTRGISLALFGACIAMAPVAGKAQTLQQSLVDRATLTVQDMIASSRPDADIRRLTGQARGVMVCPRLFKAGFILGGQGGDCVLVGRTQQGGWTDPAFYTLGSGSVGFQIGIEDAQLVMIVLTDKGLRALLDTQFKIGANASIAFATLGAGVGGGSSTALDADIVAFQNNRGLFAGVALDGGIIGTRSDFNQAYYGQPYAAQQIVLQQVAHNPGDEPLKQMLTQLTSYAPPPAPQPYGGQAYQQSPPALAPQQYSQQYVPPPQGYGQPQAPYVAPNQGYQQPSYGAPTPLSQSSNGSISAAPLAPPSR